MLNAAAGRKDSSPNNRTLIEASPRLNWPMVTAPLIGRSDAAMDRRGYSSFSVAVLYCIVLYLKNLYGCVTKRCNDS